ncbi:SpoIIE family protein phosphatase [Catellatospora tritici]|uniref:SpoIIE family protein phosphatase n=1 Tax=Catellatospora tritici TaxID=2851566 RepID=UPI001C2CC677|nr:SpoIIE family protein phosphatase [Catellatospora tritici]MBV1852800.1 SpoIIE family protein phosphatase [Catellatospora tritici]
MVRAARQQPADDDWVARVQRLESEVSGLRRAMRTRGLIEQAKGILAERLGCDPETAFGQLSTMSQQRNVSVVDLAADIVGARVPATAAAQDPVAPTSPAAPVVAPATLGSQVAASVAAPRTRVGLADNPDQPLPTAQARTLRRCLAAMDAAEDFEVLTRALVTIGMGDPPGGAAAVFVVEPDEAVRLVASHGWPAQVASEWRRSPSSLPTVVGNAARTGRPLLIDGLTPHDFVLIGPGLARAAFPLVADEQVVGVLALVWAEPQQFDAVDRGYLDQLAAGTGRALRRLWPTADDTPAQLPLWLASMLDVMDGPGHLLVPVHGVGDTVEDFTIAAVSRQARVDEGDTVGRRLLDAYPQLRANGVFDAYVKLLRDDVPFSREASTEDALIDGRPRRVVLNRRAVRIGDALLASWSRIDDALSNDERMARLETLGRFGWAEWDLRAKDAVWSAGLYGLVDREPEHGPMTLEKFAGLFAASDRGALKQLLVDLAQGGTELAELRLNTTRGIVPVRVFGEADLHDGEVRLIRLVLQDVSEKRAAQDRSTRSENAAAARQLQLAAEQALTSNLTRLLYPNRDLTLAGPGVRVTGRHYAATSPRTALRGDFCDADRLDDGSMLCVIGDTCGTGLVAAAAVVRLRFPVMALGVAGAAPADILRSINDMIMRAPDAPLASLLIARYRPQDRTLTWASAGHLQPILVRDGAARAVDEQTGPMLGLMDGMRFATATMTLAPGDSLVAFTDGVLHRRKRDPLSDFRDRVEAAHRDGGSAALWEITPTERDDEACMLVLDVE